MLHWSAVTTITVAIHCCVGQESAQPLIPRILGLFGRGLGGGVRDAFAAGNLDRLAAGYLVTGVLGGLISSTNVTFTFARMSRADAPAIAGARLRCGGRECHALSPRACRHRRSQPAPLATTRALPDRAVRDRRLSRALSLAIFV